ncbi:hypothetical protein VTO73DRAFT_15427 [Trametes versicolor]
MLHCRLGPDGGHVHQPADHRAALQEKPVPRRILAAEDHCSLDDNFEKRAQHMYPATSACDRTSRSRQDALGSQGFSALRVITSKCLQVSGTISVDFDFDRAVYKAGRMAGMRKNHDAIIVVPTKPALLAISVPATLVMAAAFEINSVCSTTASRGVAWEHCGHNSFGPGKAPNKVSALAHLTLSFARPPNLPHAATCNPVSFSRTHRETIWP